MLSPATRAAVLEVVLRLRDPMLDVRTESVGSAIRYASSDFGISHVRDVRAALGLGGPGSLARWGSGKSREEVAQALEEIAREEARTCMIFTEPLGRNWLRMSSCGRRFRAMLTGHR